MKELRLIMFTWVNFSRAPFCGVLKQPFWSRNGRSEAVFATISFKVIFCLHLWQLLTTKIWNFVDIFTRDDFMLVFVIVGGFYNSWFFDNCAILYIGNIITRSPFIFHFYEIKCNTSIITYKISCRSLKTMG